MIMEIGWWRRYKRSSLFLTSPCSSSDLYLTEILDSSLRLSIHKSLNKWSFSNSLPRRLKQPETSLVISRYLNLMECRHFSTRTYGTSLVTGFWGWLLCKVALSLTVRVILLFHWSQSCKTKKIVTDLRLMTLWCAIQDKSSRCRQIDRKGSLTRSFHHIRVFPVSPSLTISFSLMSCYGVTFGTKEAAVWVMQL